MGLVKEQLLDAFQEAFVHEYPFVFVEVVAEGIKEFIVIPEESFHDKLEFYKNAYNDNMVHVMNSNVSIKSVGYGTSDYLHSILEKGV